MIDAEAQAEIHSAESGVAVMRRGMRMVGPEIAEPGCGLERQIAIREECEKTLLRTLTGEIGIARAAHGTPRRRDMHQNGR